MTKNKSALILGVTGQDGAHLAAELLAQGFTVYGGFRRGHNSKLWRLNELAILERIKLVNINLHEPHQVMEAIKTLNPTHIYHLAGESFVADSFQQPRSIIETNSLGTLNVLEAIRISAPEARLFFASTAEIFGAVAAGQILDETSTIAPLNPYGISKLTAQLLTSMYRTRHNIWAASGIMFNHEGPLRARNFVTRKITYNLARLRLDGGEPMKLGALASTRDWGAAADYARAIPMSVNLDTPQDFIFATGAATSVQQFLHLAAEAAGFAPVFEGEGVAMTCRDKTSGNMLATVSDQYFRPFDTPPLIGNPARLKHATGFTGSRSIATIAEEMVKADLARRKNGMIHV